MNTLGIAEEEKLSDMSTPNQEALRLQAGFLNYGTDKIELSEGVKIFKGENIASAPEGVFYRREEKAILTKGVLLEFADGEITSEEMTAFFAREEYNFSDNVELLRFLDNDQEFRLNSPYLDLFLEDDSFIAKQGVIINFNQRIIKGDKVIYDDEAQTLELFDNVYIEESNGDIVRSDHAVFYLETEEFTAEGNVEVNLQS